MRDFQNTFIRILYWLGIMTLLTTLAMIAWLCIWGDQTTTSLKWLQLIQVVATFLLPPVIGAWLWSEDHRPFGWLKMDRGADWQTFALAIGIMVCAIPAINLLADLNSRVVLPRCLESIEQIFKQQEEAAAALTERFLQADNLGGLLINIGLMALLPALAEEMSFRGTLQQIIAVRHQPSAISHIAIWVTAFIFSAIHMQFYGFVPRMLMGAMFGYIFVWTGSLWVPIVMHFTNNALAVVTYYFFSDDTKSIADTIGAGDTWWLGVISIVITSLGLLIFYRRTRTR